MYMYLNFSEISWSSKMKMEKAINNLFIMFAKPLNS